MSTSVRKHALRVLIAITAAVATLLGGATTSWADNNSSRSNQTTWTYGSNSSSYFYGYLSSSASFTWRGGLTANMDWKNPYVYVAQGSGTTANVQAAKANVSATFGYITGSISASSSGSFGVSASASNKTCSSPILESSRNGISVQYSGTACTATSIVQVWLSGASATGYLRIGSSTWSSKVMNY